MKKLLIACAFLTLVSACSSTDSEYNDPWIGISEEEVITRMGLPSRSYVSSEKKYMVYGAQVGCRTGCGTSQGFTPTYVTSNAGYTFPVGSNFRTGGCGGCNTGCGNVTTTVNSCTFILSDGEVESYSGCRF